MGKGEKTSGLLIIVTICVGGFPRKCFSPDAVQAVTNKQQHATMTMTTTMMMQPSLHLLIQRVIRSSLQWTTHPIPRIFRYACTTTSSFRWLSNKTISNNKNKDDTMMTPLVTVTIMDEADHHHQHQSDPSTTKHFDKSEFTWGNRQLNCV
jgi:hypothetical protein